EKRGKRRPFVGAFLDHAGDRVTHRFRTLGIVAVEVHVAEDGQAESDDGGKKGPAGDGVEAIGHRRICLPEFRFGAALVTGAQPRKSDSHLSAASGAGTRQRRWTAFPLLRSRWSNRCT